MASPFKGDILKGKVALLTGGGSGIGYEISVQLGKHGASIAIMGRRKHVVDSAVSALTSLGIQVIFPTFPIWVSLYCFQYGKKSFFFSHLFYFVYSKFIYILASQLSLVLDFANLILCPFLIHKICRY